jgi:hypothetical protein
MPFITSADFPDVVVAWWRVPLHLLSLGVVVLLLIPEWRRIRRRKTTH